MARVQIHNCCVEATRARDDARRDAAELRTENERLKQALKFDETLMMERDREIARLNALVEKLGLGRDHFVALERTRAR